MTNTLSFPYFNNSHAQEDVLSDYYVFKLEGYSSILGHIPSNIATRFPLTSDWKRDDQDKQLIFQPRNGPMDTVEAFDHRNRVLAQYLQELREQKVFKVLAGWRNEMYPIYGPNRQLLLSMERAATPLFGVVSYGVHMTAFTHTEDGMKLWTPRRSETKQTYPGMMDNTVAGGLSTGESPFDCMIRESMEEASLPEEIVSRAKCCGTLTYHYIRSSKAGGEVGLSQPECQYIYDLELPSDVIPRPNDNEAIDFRALSIPEVQEALAAGKFKPNCALLLLEFFVRHGILTPENEPDYIELVSRLHRRFEYPTA